MMSRIITFSRYIQRADGSHRKQEHQPTYFVEQILNSLGVEYLKSQYLTKLEKLNPKVGNKLLIDFYNSLSEYCPNKKLHTIRSPKKPFKVGDKFTPAIWTAKPYSSPQIKFYGDIEVKQTWDIEIKVNGDFKSFNIINSGNKTPLFDVAKNDGLSKIDFLNWFGESSNSQIICWDSNLKY